MSRSRILILSKDSTFSYWSAFLSEALVIMPATDWQAKIRQPGSGYMEIKWNDRDVESGKRTYPAIAQEELLRCGNEKNRHNNDPSYPVQRALDQVVG